MTVDEWAAELQEFAQAARVFKPMTGLMATRFTSSSQRTEGGGSSNAEDILRVPQKEPDDPAEAAAKLGMFGPMTRSSRSFLPTKLVCKRFGVKPPVDIGPEEEESGPVKAQTGGHSSAAVDQLVRESSNVRMVAEPAVLGTTEPHKRDETATAPVDHERNTALEQDRPGDALFQAIFGSDDSD